MALAFFVDRNTSRRESALAAKTDFGGAGEIAFTHRWVAMASRVYLRGRTSVPACRN